MKNMTAKLKLYIGLVALGLALLGGGLWFLFNPITSDPITTPVIDVPEGEPVIALELGFIMRGRFEKLYLYDSGGVLHIEDKNLRMPTPENPPTRIWRTGSISSEELSSIIRLFQTEEYTGMEEYYNFSGRPMDPIKGAPSGGFTRGDGRFTFSINYGDLQKTVDALGYLTPDKGLTYPDMPYPLNEIYEKLKQIIENSTKEVYSEPIQSSDSGTSEENNGENEKITKEANTGEDIIATRVYITSKSIQFSGHTTLQDDTLLQTQLYVEEQPVEWWPADRYVEVKDKKWQVNVPLGKDGAPSALSVGPTYVLEVWEKDNPSVMGSIMFDLIGPPGEK